MPRGLGVLVDQHGGGEIEGWNDTDEEKVARWGDILDSFCEVCKIWGYLDDEYMANWEESLAFVDAQQDPEDSDAPWVLFYCSDEKLVYSLKLNRSTGKIMVTSMNL